jgi:putative two-component system response regulator
MSTVSEPSRSTELPAVPDPERENVEILGALGEYYDDDSTAHAWRVGHTAVQIAEAMGLDGTFAARLGLAAPLHDIGKIGISRRVLLKPGALTEFERENMMRHVEIGAGILGRAASPVLRMAAAIARSHHERWNGSGYMLGLAGEQIPLAARITSVADVFDVLTHQRPYKQAWDVDRALMEICDQAGRQFDPRVVAAFRTLDVPALRNLPGQAPSGMAPLDL